MHALRSISPEQIGYLVDDVEQAVKRWQQHFAVGPWTLFRNVSLSGEYRGQAVTIGMDVALGYQGSTQIELIQPVAASASPYHNTEGRLLRGIHHIAWVVDDFKQAVTQLTATGLQVVFQGQNPTTRVAYLENTHDPSVLYEIIYGEGMREMMEQGIALSRSWDGTNPLAVIEL